MKVSQLLYIAAYAFGAAEAFECKQDSCYKQVSNTKSPLEDAKSRRSECSRYLRTTIVPTTTTITAYRTVTASTKKTVAVFTRSTAIFTTRTVTNTATATSTAALQARDGGDAPLPTSDPELEGDEVSEEEQGLEARANPTPSTITVGGKPSYAKSCSGPGGFKSACLCWGAKATTITKARPTTVKVITRTVTPTVGVTTTRSVIVSRTATRSITTTTIVQPPPVVDPASLQTCAQRGNTVSDNTRNECRCCWNTRAVNFVSLSGSFRIVDGLSQDSQCAAACEDNNRLCKTWVRESSRCHLYETAGDRPGGGIFGASGVIFGSKEAGSCNNRCPSP